MTVMTIKGTVEWKGWLDRLSDFSRLPSGSPSRSRRGCPVQDYWLRLLSANMPIIYR